MPLPTPLRPDPHSAWLVEIQSAISTIEEFCAGMDRTSYLADLRTGAAVAMYLVVIGESAARLPDSVRQEAPEVPWPMIVSLRNRIAHGYRSIDQEIVWSIVQNNLSSLRTAVARMLATRGEA